MTGTGADATVLMPITDEEFNLLRTLIHHKFGINLSDQKKSLLVGRLQKVLRQSGHATFKTYYDSLISDQTEQQLGQLVDHISTNHTYFNREKNHFDFFSQTALPSVVDRLRRNNDQDLRIWCAGCSTGEEAYMLLMLLHEHFGEEYKRWNCGILATDISSRVLDIAEKGQYPEEKIAMIPEALKKKYLHPLAGDQYVFHDRLRKDATFRRFNLMNEKFPFKKPFDIVFCRNVMIYFDAPTRWALIKKFHQVMHPGGYLFIGHSETLGRQQSHFKYLVPAVYQKELA